MSSAISIDQVELLHRLAMELCDRALEARAIGEQDRAMELFRESFGAESQAAFLVSDMLDFEPTRSVLHRSAAALALDCSEFRAAERHIATALAGNPPEEIAEELRDLLEQVHFSRHLELRGLQLAPNEFQISISGKKVGFGIVASEEFVDRVRATEKMILRNFERLSGRPFREAGPALKEISRSCEVYLSVPRAASFAATMRVGVPERQMNLPGIDRPVSEEPERIIDNLVDCLEAFALGDGGRVDELIPDPAYRRNFAALAYQLLPDGENIRQVGFTVTRDGVRRDVALLPQASTSQKENREERPNGVVRVEGRLLFADARASVRNRIQVIDDGQKSHDFLVPEGMMVDIVKPLWEDRVVVLGIKRKASSRAARLESIVKAAEKPDY